MKRKILVTGAVIIAAIILLVLFLRPVETDDKIRVGVILPLTGPLAYLGEEEKNAILLLDKLHPELTENIEFIFEDSRGEVQHGVTAYHKLKRQGVNHFILSLTRVAQAIKPLLVENEDIGFALSIKPDIAKDNKFMFRAYWGLDDQIPYWLDLIESKDAKKVAALYVSDPSFDIAINMFRDSCDVRGLKFLGSEDYNFDQTDIRPNFEKVIALNPDVIIVEDFGNIFPLILNEAERRGVSEKIITGAVATYVPKELFDVAKGITFVGPASIIKNTEGFQKLSNLYYELFGKKVSLGGLFSYKSGYLLIRSINEAGQDPVDISDYLINKSFYVINENVYIDSTGTARFEYVFGIFEDGSIKPYFLD